MFSFNLFLFLESTYYLIVGLSGKEVLQPVIHFYSVLISYAFLNELYVKIGDRNRTAFKCSVLTASINSVRSGKFTILNFFEMS